MNSGVLGKSRITVLAVISLALALLTGCGGSSGGGESSSSGGDSAGTPQPGGTLTVALSEELNTLDPQQSIYPNETWVTAQISEPLWREGADGKLVPWLIEKVETSQGERVWTLTLKSGIKFSNGQEMTSADVLFTLEKARKSEFWEELLEGITKVEAPSPSTIVITNAKPAAELPTLLSQWSFGIEPKDLAGESDEEFASKPIGTGPFMVGNWKRGEALTLVKNPHYWVKGQPYVDQLSLKIVPDANSRVTQLNSDQANVIYAPPWSQVEGIEAGPETEFEDYPLGFVKLLTVNGREALFKNPKVREAVNLGLDREGMVAAVLHEHGEAAGSFVPPAVGSYDASIEAAEYDPEKAKELLAEAVKEGVDPSFQIVLPIEDDFWPEAVQIVQQNLTDVGFQVQIQKVDLSTAIENASAGKFGAWLGFSYTPLTTQLEIWGYYNFSEGWWAGIGVDETTQLAEEALQTPDEAKREQIYFQMQEVVDDEKYVLPVVYTPYSWANRTDVKDLNVGRVGIPWFSEAWLSE